TIRTARSRTSGENLLLVCFVMLPLSQKLEPPKIPVRFGLLRCELSVVGSYKYWATYASCIHPCSVIRPFEKLRGRIDLVVMTRVWKCEKFVQEVTEPRSFLRQVYLTCLKASALGFHAHEFVAYWRNADGHGHADDSIRPELLKEMQAGTS